MPKKKHGGFRAGSGRKPIIKINSIRIIIVRSEPEINALGGQEFVAREIHSFLNSKLQKHVASQPEFT